MTSMIESMVEKLFEETDVSSRCPNIRRDESGMPYCGKNFANNAEPSQTRKDVCSIESLQDFCLAGERRYRVCPYHNGEPLD